MSWDASLQTIHLQKMTIEMLDTSIAEMRQKRKALNLTRQSCVFNSYRNLRSNLWTIDYKMATHRNQSFTTKINLNNKNNVLLYLPAKAQAQDKHGILTHLLSSQPPNLTPCTRRKLQNSMKKTLYFTGDEWIY